MDRDGIDRIVQLTHNQNPLVRSPDFERSGTFFLRGASGEFEEYTAAFERPEATFYDTASLAGLFKDGGEGDRAIEVYYSSGAIVALVDDGNYRRHIIPLEKHPSFARLEQLANTETFDQKGLIRLLRAEFNGHVSESVIERFRSLKLKTDGEGSSVIAQGRAAVDRRIQQQIRDERGEEIPTEIEVTVPVYDLDEARGDLMEVTVLVDVTPGDDGRPAFELTAVVNGLRDAERAALDHIVENLRNQLPSTIPVYYGRA